MGLSTKEVQERKGSRRGRVEVVQVKLTEALKKRNEELRDEENPDDPYAAAMTAKEICTEVLGIRLDDIGTYQTKRARDLVRPLVRQGKVLSVRKKIWALGNYWQSVPAYLWVSNEENKEKGATK